MNISRDPITVAMLFGNVAARIENDAVVLAAKPIASADLTMKHKEINMGPSGAKFNMLKREIKTGINFKKGMLNVLPCYLTGKHCKHLHCLQS